MRITITRNIGKQNTYALRNRLNGKFSASDKNLRWCTGFTYLFLTDGSKRYNCTITELYDRSVVASITDKFITSDLAIRTIQKAISAQNSKIDTSALILYSDQRKQYTSGSFTDFCENIGITQSISKADCPYDNAPMERYFNTLKNELR